MPDWKQHITRRNIILAVPWIYLAVYLFAWYGMSRLYNDVMNGNAIIDPVYNTMELTMMMSYWVVTILIVCGYLLVRYACRLAAGLTASQRISALERRIEDLESDDSD